MTTERTGPGAWFTVAATGVAVVVLVYIVDVVLAVDIHGSAQAIIRAVTLTAAVAAAGACYQRWSTLGERTPPDHVMAGATLLGGALTASALFREAPGAFGDARTGTLGVVALVLGLVAAFAGVRERRVGPGGGRSR